MIFNKLEDGTISAEVDGELTAVEWDEAQFCVVLTTRISPRFLDATRRPLALQEASACWEAICEAGLAVTPEDWLP